MTSTVEYYPIEYFEQRGLKLPGGLVRSLKMSDIQRLNNSRNYQRALNIFNINKNKERKIERDLLISYAEDLEGNKKLSFDTKVKFYYKTAKLLIKQNKHMKAAEFYEKILDCYNEYIPNSPRIYSVQNILARIYNKKSNKNKR